MNHQRVLISGLVISTILNIAFLAGCGGGAIQSLNDQPSSQQPTGVTGAFTAISSMTTARANHTATLLPNGEVLIAGGSDGSQPLASAELYEPASGMFTPTGSMTTAGVWMPATLLANGRVLFAGNNAQLYEPTTGTFALVGSYADTTSVSWDTATLLLDGRVLLTGCACPPDVGAAELFDLRTASFSITGPRHEFELSTASLLTNGTVLVVTATFDVPPDDAELYDPTSGTFTYIGRTIGYHAFSAAVRLADGTVLITGGQLPGGNGSSDSEFYLPATRTFASAGNMTTGRDSHTATLLADGTVLIAGGISTWGSPPQMTSSAEIYNPARSAP